MKSFPFLTLLACLLLSVTQSLAQGLEWAYSYGGIAADMGYAVDKDAAGNVYSAGLFHDSTDFDPGPGTWMMFGDGPWDAFVTKMDAAGNLLWAVDVGGAGNDQALDIALDAQGNVYVAGLFTGTLDFDPGPGVFNLYSGSGPYGQVPYIWKLDSNGNLIWAVAFPGYGGIGFHLALDPAGNVAMAGYFLDTMSFGPYTYTSSPLAFDLFVVKVSSAGTVLWAKQVGGSDYETGYAVAMDAQSNVYFGGNFDGTVDFDPGPGVAWMVADTTNAGYVCKFDAAGNFVWVREIDPVAGSALTTNIACNAQGDVFAAGQFLGTLDMDPGPGAITLVNQGQSSAYIARWDSAGNIAWARGFGGDSTTVVNGLQIDAMDNLYFAGYFNGTTDFDPGPGTTNHTSQLKDIFIGKWDASGNFIFADRYGGTGNDRGYDFCAGANATYAIGRFENTADFDPGPAVHNLTAIGGADVVIQKFQLCQPTDTTMDTMSCGSFTAPSGAVYQSSGTYLDVIPNVAGCDSLITLHLTIQSTQATISQQGNVLTANPAGATYQWANCESGFVILSGEVQQAFAPTVSGSYAVIVTIAGCSDTSACTPVTIVGMTAPIIDALRLSPNPAAETIVLHIPAEFSSQYFRICDMTGRVHVAGWLDHGDKTITVGHLAPGMYIVAFGGSSRWLRFVKE